MFSKGLVRRSVSQGTEFPFLLTVANFSLCQVSHPPEPRFLIWGRGGAVILPSPDLQRLKGENMKARSAAKNTQLRMFLLPLVRGSGDGRVFSGHGPNGSPHRVKLEVRFPAERICCAIIGDQSSLLRSELQE